MSPRRDYIKTYILLLSKLQQTLLFLLQRPLYLQFYTAKYILRKLQQTFSSQTQESLCLQYYMVNGNNQWQQCTVYNSFAIPFGVLYMLNMKEWYSFMLHTHVVYTVVYCYWYLQLTVIYIIYNWLVDLCTCWDMKQ